MKGVRTGLLRCETCEGTGWKRTAARGAALDFRNMCQFCEGEGFLEVPATPAALLKRKARAWWQDNGPR